MNPPTSSPLIFTLEALKAAFGDALLLHFGPPKAPRLAIIDGGPSGVYGSVLKPRLGALMKNKGRLTDGQLAVRLVMVSHIDDDHVNGILAMAKELAEHAGKRPYRIESLWHNSFDDILGNTASEMAASLGPFVKDVLRTGTVPAGAPPMQAHSALVMASVTQGRDLRNAAKKLAWDINKEFGGRLIQLAKKGAKPIPIGDPGGLTFTVLGPTESNVEELSKKWDKEIAAKGLAKDSTRVAAYLDDSAFNLASIIVMAEAPGGDGRPRRMLLTGDARGDHILEGLKAANYLANGVCHVDLLKLPHHGSNRNLEPAFFKTVTADHYLVSSNGAKFDNPDLDTLQWLADARKGTGPFTIYLTYPVSEFKFKKWKTVQKDLQAFIDAGKKSGAYRVVCRSPNAPSVSVDLGVPLTD